MPNRSRDPRTKEELLDRMLSRDFDGDITHIGAEQASLIRTAPNKLLLSFPASGRTYELVARLPRKENVANEERSFNPPGGRDDWTVEPETPAETKVRRQEAGRNQTRSRPSVRA